MARPTPPPPSQTERRVQARPSGAAPDWKKIIDSAADQKKEQEGAQAASDMMSRFGNSSGLGGLIERGVKAPLQALGYVGRAGVATVDELAGSSFGRVATAANTNGLGQVLQAFDTTDNAEDPRGWLDKVEDERYGFGQAMKTTGSKWGDRFAGFVGDVAFDPTTYVGTAATKASMGADRASRETMAGMLARSEQFSDLAGSAAKYGAAFLPKEAREFVGMRGPGLYFGIGESSLKVPGTERLASAIEKTGSTIRANTVSKVTNPLNRFMRTPDDLTKARQVLAANKTIDNVTPADAASVVRFYQVKKTARGGYAHRTLHRVKDQLNGVDKREATALAHATETGAAEGAWARQIFRDVRQDAVDAGVEIGDMGENWIPHMRSQQGARWLMEDEDGRNLAAAIRSMNPNADPSTLYSRELVPGATMKLPGNKEITIPQSGTARDINDAIQKAIPGAPRVYEEDVRKLISAYVNQIGTAIGVRQAWQDAVTGANGDMVKALKGMPTDQLDELATYTANRELRKELKNAAKARKSQYNKRVAQANRDAEALRKHLGETFRQRAKDIGDDVVVARKELKAISDEIAGGGSVEKVQKQFVSLRKKLDTEVGRVAKEIDKANDDLMAAQLRVQRATVLPTSRPEGTGSGTLGWWDGAIPMEGETHPIILQHQDAIARLQDELGEFEEAKDAVDELYADFYEQAARLNELNEVADSPDMIREAAMEMGAETVEYKVPIYGEPDVSDDISVQTLLKRIEEAESPEAVEAATEISMENAARAGLVRDSLVRRARAMKGQITRSQRRLNQIPKFVEADQYAKQYAEALDTAEDGVIAGMGDARAASGVASLKEQQRDIARYETGGARLGVERAGDAVDDAQRRLADAETPRPGQRSQIYAGVQEQRAAQAEVERTAAKYEDLSEKLASAEVELEEALARIGKGDKSATDRVTRLLDSVRFIRGERERIAPQMGGVNPEWVAERRKLDRQWRTYARMNSAAREYDELAKNPVARSARQVGEGDQVKWVQQSTPDQLRDMLVDVERAARGRELRRDILGYETRIREVARRGIRTPEELDAAEAAIKAEQQLYIEQGAQALGTLKSKPGKAGSREVSDEEADILNEYMTRVQNGIYEAKAEFEKLKNERAKLFPTSSDSRYADGGGFEGPQHVSRNEYSDAGFKLPSYGMTKEDYDAAAAGAGVPSFHEIRRRGYVDEASDFDELAEQEVDLEDLDLGSLFAGESGTAKAASKLESDVEKSARWERAMAADDVKQEMAGRGKIDYEDLTEQMKEARRRYHGAKRAYATVQRAYRMDTPDAMKAFPYGKRDYIMLVDRAGDGQLRVGRAVRTTENELFEEAKAKNLIKDTGRRPKHAELARMLGYKAKLYKPGTAAYKKLPEGIKESALRTTAREQVRLMPESARRALLADARKAGRDTAEYRAGREAFFKRQLDDIATERKAFEEAQAVARQAAEVQAAEVAELGRRIERIQLAEQGASDATLARNKLAADTAAAGEAAQKNLADAQEAVGAAGERLERGELQLEAYSRLEAKIGKDEADAVKAFQADQTVKLFNQINAEASVEAGEQAKKRVQKLGKRLPSRWRQDKTTRSVVKQRMEGLSNLIEEAAKDGGTDLKVAAELEATAMDALGRVDQEVTFGQGLQGMRARAQKAMRVLKDPDASEAEKLAAAKNSPVGPIMRALTDGFEAVESRAFPEGADYVVKAELKRMLTNVETGLRQDLPGWLRVWDEANQLFKTYATSTPGFHVRNFMSATFMNMTEGVGVSTTARAQSKWQEYVKAATKGGAEFDDWWVKQSPQVQTALAATLGSGVAGHYSAAELGQNLASQSASWLKDNKVVRSLRHFGEDRVEGPTRLALGMHYAENRGANVMQALSAIERIHFNYSDVSKFDRGMKRIIPFWTFMSRNLPLQVEQIWHKPRAYAMYNHFLDNFDQSQGEEEYMPGYLGEMGAIVGGRGVLGGDDMVVAPDLPHVRMGQELNSFFPDPTRLMSSASPFARLPVELSTNHSFFYDGELQGDAWDKALYAATGMVPPVGQAQRVGGIGRYDDRQLQGAANYVGLPIKQLNDEVRAAEMRRRAFAD